MWEDEIIDGLHRIREEHAKSFNYDLDAMFEDWQKKQTASDRQVIKSPQSQNLTAQQKKDKSPTSL